MIVTILLIKAELLVLIQAAKETLFISRILRYLKLRLD